ncbi:MAG TPA: NADH dehydrogenase (quinone) subunit D [Blastocatellia bacterium]|nr:NADH dehydrogenase (quinone) subunit D [Blastocatellia bacterium]HMX24866.1 NADH dehydrogenase (quinone) subunit D [Blastocatellia bacterium]HMY73673.1 NADH dehydrogenase (quinone) subunit D [Blastocatellia bacterium]HMZ19467.1 NADH dehydrogenase (quinone) subunit D [Blastocatellia bacterium]HNG33912.1 NADH dehydrogenase (quinone) subunit D [Blastocatellia bacterium]
MADTRMTVSMGPQHPSTHGVLRLELVLDGETVVSAIPDIGYLHTGMEKTMEKEKWQQVVTITCRMDYLNSMGNDLGYCLAVEKLMGVEVPERAKVLRVLLTELNRITSHLVWFGTHAMDIGAMTAFFYAFTHREKVLDIFECATGARFHQSYFIIGGCRWDVPDNFFSLVKDFLDGFPSFIEECKKLVTGNRIFQRRTQGIGVIKKEDAINWALSGPTIRGSGVNWDIRKSEPYSGYETYDFKVPVYDGCDVWSRYLVRMDEFEESYKICCQALERLRRPGEVIADHPKIKLPARDLMKQHIDVMIHHFLLASEGFTVPVGEVYQAIESARGEIGYYVVSNGAERPHRVRVRAPSFVNLSALPAMVEGSLIADVVAVIGSIDIVLGDVDR